jgi:lactam utilization protein B
MTDFDRQHVAEILAGEGTWFTAHLFRLISKADKDNRKRIALGFPAEVAAVNNYQTGAINAACQVEDEMMIHGTDGKGGIASLLADGEFWRRAVEMSPDEFAAHYLEQIKEISRKNARNN